jgi:hypothetical protein
MEFKDVLKERLKIDYSKRLFKLIPRKILLVFFPFYLKNYFFLEEFFTMVKSILTLKFEQEPDYDDIINTI